MKKSLTEEQKNLIALVPTHEITNKLTESAKLVLGNIILLYGMDKAAENGYIFRDNLTMCEETGKSEKTVIASVRKLVQVGLITTKRGKRKSASEYYLTDKYFEISGEERPQQNYSIDYSKTNEYYSKTFDVMGIIEAMQQEINELKKQVEELKTTVNITVKGDNYSKTEVYYSTETESEKEKDEIIHDCILHEPEQSVNSFDDYEEILNNVDYEEVERVQAAYLQDPNPSSSSYKERNEWATRCYEELETTIQVLFKCWDANMVIAYADKVNSILDKVDEHINEGWFTQAQISKFDAITNNFNSIIRKKAELIGQHDSSVQVTEQSAESNEQYSSIENKNNMGGCAAPKQITFNPKHFIRVGERVLEMINEGREQRSIDNYSFNEFTNEYGSEWVGTKVHPYYQLTTNAIWNGKVDALENKVNQLKECA